MSYRDKEKQKEATKDRVRRYRNKQKGVTLEGVTLKGVTDYSITIDKERAVKLLRVCHHLDRDITGLYGRENMLDLVRYGSISMRDVRNQIQTNEVVN